MLQKYTLQEIDLGLQQHMQQDAWHEPQAMQLIKTLLYVDPNEWSHVVQSKTSMDWELSVVDTLYHLPHSGDFLLLQLKNEGFLLLRHLVGQWHTLMPDGTNQVFELNAEVSTHQGILLKKWQQAPQPNKVFESIFAFLKKEWVEIGLSSVLINGGLLLMPLFSMLIYDKVVNNGIFETLWALTIGMLIYITTDLAMRLSRNWSIENMARHLSMRADSQLWQRILQDRTRNLPFARVLTHYSEVSASRDFISSHYLLALVDLPFLALYLVAIGIIAWPLLIVTLLLMVAYVGFSHWIQKKVTRININTEQFISAKMSFLSDALQNKDLIKTTPHQNWFSQQWQTHAQQTAVAESQKRYVSGWANVLAATLASITSVSLLVVGTYLIHAKFLSVGGLIASNLLASRAMSIVHAFYMVFAKWQDFKRATHKLDQEVGQESNSLHSNPIKTSAQGHFTINGISKTQEGRPPLLQHINLNIQAKERVALLGKPGAGKSTLLKAMCGLTAVDTGTILIDGVEIKTIANQDLAKWIAWKGQELTLFAGTLAENLMVFGTTHQEEMLEQALWVSTLEDELRTGKLSLNMRIEPQGLNLSGGQRQKIALARTLAQNTKILLLDEPTLGLDSDTENLLVARLEKTLPTDTTLILTTHSSAVLRLTRRIIALDQGKVVADGPTEQLLIKKPSQVSAPEHPANSTSSQPVVG